MIGILVVAMLDTYGVISTEGPVSASVFYGIGGVGGGVVAYQILRRLRLGSRGNRSR
jgi:hypothetical protein